MSGAQTSPFLTTNELLAPMAAYDTHTNALLQQQQRTQDITDHDIAAVGQAAAPLLNLNEDQAAAAYPGWLQDMQSRGLAKYAPPTYPGHAVTAALVQRAMPILQQIQTGFLTTPGSADARDRLNQIYTGAGNQPAQGGPPAASSGAPATGDGLTGDKAHDLPLIAQRESGGSPTVLNFVARDDPTAYARGATASGKYQIVNSTWREGMQLAGLDPSQYATARDAPEQVQDKVASAIYDKYGAKPWQKGSQDWVKDEQGRYQLATVRPPAGAPGGVPSTPPPGGPGSAATPAPYRVASNAPTPPPTVPGTPAATPQPTYTDTETGLPVIGTQPGAPATTPQPQAQIPQPPANRAMPGRADGPPAQTPPPVQQPPPAPRAALPRAADVPQGLNSPQIQQAQRLRQAAGQIEMEAARNPFDKRLQAEAAAKAADLKQRAQSLEQTDTVVQTQDGQLHVATGKIDDPSKPLADYHETSPGSGIWVGGPGTDPKFQPPGRLIIDKAGDVWRTTTGGAEKLSRLDPVAVAALSAAQAQGTGVGQDVAKQMPALVAQGRNSTQAIGNIDYGMNQLREAAKSGIPTGYFSQWLATGAAAAKSLGIDLSALGVDPKAVGNIQSAQKTLGVVAGAILQQAIGKDSQITDAKIEHFIHTQPGIETDPQAVERVLNWARSQFVYENEMSRAAVNEAANSPTGTLPLNWQARYFRDKGFAPIYDPGTGEMQQPEGRSPTREPPPPQIEVAPVNPSARTMDKIYQTKQGPMKWKGTGWLPVQ